MIGAVRFTLHKVSVNTGLSTDRFETAQVIVDCVSNSFASLEPLECSSRLRICCSEIAMQAIGVQFSPVLAR